jgi:tripeptide aminopeptidase
MTCRRDEAGAVTGSDTGNLIATLPGNAAGAPAMFFAAHMDTVEPNPDVNIIIEGDVIRTDGSTILGADDRSGIAPILEALTVVGEDGLRHGPVQAVFTVCEEVGLLGAKHINADLLEASFGYVLDSGPPVGSVVVSAPSQDSMTVTITGKPAHAGAEPEKGISAIEVAARAISKMKLGRIDAETTANIGSIHGGQATNIVCPEVVMQGEARSRDARKLAKQVRHMVETFEESAKQYGAAVTVDLDHQYEAYRLSRRSQAVTIAAHAAKRLGLAVEFKSVGGGSDANVFNANGLPACVLGTAMRSVHTHEEHASIEDLYRTAHLVLAIIEEGARVA